MPLSVAQRNRVPDLQALLAPGDNYCPVDCCHLPKPWRDQNATLAVQLGVEGLRVETRRRERRRSDSLRGGGEVVGHQIEAHLR
jgi:hypothetical protein